MELSVRGALDTTFQSVCWRDGASGKEVRKVDTLDSKAAEREGALLLDEKEIESPL
jgi:hypothetical protein